MENDELTDRLEQLERRVESLETSISARLGKLEEELIRLKARVARLPVSEKATDILDDIREASQELRVLGSESGKQGG